MRSNRDAALVAAAEMSAEERATKIDVCGGMPLNSFSRYTKKGRIARNELGAVLGISQVQLTRLLSVFEGGMGSDNVTIDELQVLTLRRAVDLAFEEFGTTQGQFAFIRNPNVARKSMKDLQTIFFAFGYVPEWRVE